MYRVSYEKFNEILCKGGCHVALAGLNKHDIEPESIRAIEIDFNVDDEGTDDEVLSVLEFYIYLKSNVVLFGEPLKHEQDFTIHWVRTKPSDNSVYLGPTRNDMQNVKPKVLSDLAFLHNMAVCACEFALTTQTKDVGPQECDKAYSRITDYLATMTNLMNHARGRLGDLSRVIEKQCGDAEADDEINKRIDEIYNLLTTKKES